MVLYQLFNLVQYEVAFSWRHCKVHAKIVDVSVNVTPMRFFVSPHRYCDHFNVHHAVPYRCQEENDLHDARQVHNVGHELSYDVLTATIHRHLGTSDE